MAKIHLIAPAGSCRRFVEQLGLASADTLIAHIQGIVGSDFAVTGDADLIAAAEDDDRGGRGDDRERAADIQRALADQEVAAIVALRGGAWFTRILQLIDFFVLDRRARPVSVFGFSELTTLVNIVGAHANGRGIYDLCPGSLPSGLRRHARMHLGLSGEPEGRSPADDWMKSRLLPEFAAYFLDVISIIEGRGTCRGLTAERVAGELPDRCEATFVGGNLCVLTTLLGSEAHRDVVNPAGRWLVIEDINEKPERIDRFLAHLTLAGFWDLCAGILVGDFHLQDRQFTAAVAAMLAYHLPPDCSVPILTTTQVGHVWPMSPLPLHVPLTLERSGENDYSIRWSNLRFDSPTAEAMGRPTEDSDF